MWKKIKKLFGLDSPYPESVEKVKAGWIGTMSDGSKRYSTTTVIWRKTNGQWSSHESFILAEMAEGQELVKKFNIES